MTSTLASLPLEVPTQAFRMAVEIRHDLHSHPELGYEETRTAGVIEKRLRDLGVECVGGLAGGTGVLGWIPATKPGGKTVALRADIDALPIAEETGVKHASTFEGRMHACGHDGHTANLLLTAEVLLGVEDRPNNVLLVFQPAEEGGGGGDRMCRDGVLSGTVLGEKADMIYGLHGWPEMPLGTVASKKGPLLAATDTFTVTVRATGGHAAFPHTTPDTIAAAASMVSQLQAVVAREVSPVDSAVLSVTKFHGGSTHNVLPPEVSFGGTVRTMEPATREHMQAALRRHVAGVAASFGAEAEVEWVDGYPATVNEPGATQTFFEVARAGMGDDRVVELPTGFMGGEDFAYYGEHCPACFFIVGLNPDPSRPYAGLHTPKFDFNDDAMRVGTALFVALATRSYRAFLPALPGTEHGPTRQGSETGKTSRNHLKSPDAPGPDPARSHAVFGRLGPPYETP